MNADARQVSASGANDIEGPRLIVGATIANKAANDRLLARSFLTAQTKSAHSRLIERLQGLAHPKEAAQPKETAQPDQNGLNLCNYEASTEPIVRKSKEPFNKSVITKTRGVMSDDSSVDRPGATSAPVNYTSKEDPAIHSKPVTPNGTSSLTRVLRPAFPNQDTRPRECTCSRSEAGSRLGATPESYVASIRDQVRHQRSSSPLLGEIFQILSERLNKENMTNGVDEIATDAELYFLSGNGQLDHRPLLSVREWDALDVYRDPACCMDQTLDSIPKIVILRGNQPAQCLPRVGAKFNVDPQVFLRHLQHLWGGKDFRLFASLALPSTSVDVISLSVMTLGKHGYSGLSLPLLRDRGQMEMNKYLHEVTTDRRMQAGDSLVRRYWIHSLDYFSVEQEITVSLQRMDRGWTLLIWTDIARPLHQGPLGPWYKQLKPSGLFTNTFVRQIRLPGITLDREPAVTTSPFAGPKSDDLSRPRLRHSLVYGVKNDPILMAVDPFYCVLELFELSASSLDQLLKLIGGLMQERLGYGHVGGSPMQDHADLLFQQDVLNRVRERIVSSLADIRHYSNTWPSTAYEEQKEQIDRARDNILHDFEDLRQRTDRLLLRCHEGMAMCTSRAAIDEAGKSMDQAKKVAQLTWLAFLFMPLSFAASIFGMNNSFLMEYDTVSMVCWITLAIGMGTTSYAVLFAAGQRSKS
ncbi:hypothetical protein BDZ85DRAFT_277678 [Elsinoe ampelina]|uniref:Cora-like Mg2+ transporter protein-domain-containing protein n=1 Tax=Elsinoe ampelina TaxID=302913 RepID=A0A6A6GQ19_9PEZI|nr:hypothetical protein BDZ85DRAFT_277678 [Elsinoe ampelina]